MANLTKLKLLSPAKINLFLSVLNRRDDGYHNLQTVFQFIDFVDEMEFELNDHGTITLNSPDTDFHYTDNIVFKAAWLLQEKTKTHLGVDITLRKHIPMGGGLGGGSSNAATTLIALNHLWDTQLSTKALAKLGLQLGADVAVFIEGHAAFATGIGETLTPIDIPENWYAIVLPAVSVSTGEIFSHPQLTRNAPAITIDDFLSHGGPNSCEAVTTTLYPEVREALQWLSQFGSAKMSGTGSAVFASFASKGQAEEVINQLPSSYKGVVAKGRNKSPLFAQFEY